MTELFDKNISNNISVLAAAFTHIYVNPIYSKAQTIYEDKKTSSLKTAYEMAVNNFVFKIDENFSVLFKYLFDYVQKNITNIHSTETFVKTIVDMFLPTKNIGKYSIEVYNKLFIEIMTAILHKSCHIIINDKALTAILSRNEHALVSIQDDIKHIILIQRNETVVKSITKGGNETLSVEMIKNIKHNLETHLRNERRYKKEIEELKNENSALRRELAKSKREEAEFDLENNSSRNKVELLEDDVNLFEDDDEKILEKKSRRNRK